MKTVFSLEQIRKISSELRKNGRTIGFIPTMGALHAGHLKLVKESKNKNDVTVVSIFVNPAQFSPTEDLVKYPRPFEQDKQLLEQEKIDYLFYPNAKTMYPNGFQTYVTPNNLSNILEGKSRPGHFSGVATVVLKLSNLVNPTHAYFGQKDFQQSVVVKQMVYDLNLPININVVPTVRDKDGLALSSRNIFLNPQERSQALSLYQSLLLAKKLILSGNKSVQLIKKEMKNYLQKNKLIQLDYIEICNPENLSPLKVTPKKAVILIAAFVGKTRLIDNIII
ncbi:pantoate--beta-alanine ligase [Candidatus Roizmanbacteria bacterium CG_4_10_14_0_2_um_filter_33_96]|uniref:Pantothenate synthetase n=1 Tax=Candidatus Roizmanbacteria bacterium CG_4_10_14_0_2_um_filter_33_96 TaxID=1974821 RepID=A0A2M7U9C1_9BACT|nr:MAG: pantoate--beta-alanine ligase [Candidatus Roizmanbacteria bacterium CG_4_10_14_0_2_um_filter_33_96]